MVPERGHFGRRAQLLALFTTTLLLLLPSLASANALKKSKSVYCADEKCECKSCLDGHLLGMIQLIFIYCFDPIQYCTAKAVRWSSILRRIRIFWASRRTPQCWFTAKRKTINTSTLKWVTKVFVFVVKYYPVSHFFLFCYYRSTKAGD